MGKPKMKDFDIPDPLAIIEAEKQANRTDQVTPFGQTVWNGDQQVTTLSPEMQAMSDRMFSLGMQDSQRAPTPDWLNDIAQGIGQSVGQRYGIDIGNAGGIVGKRAKQAAPPPMSAPVENPGNGWESPIQPVNGLTQQAEQFRQLIAQTGADGGEFQRMIERRMR